MMKQLFNLKIPSVLGILLLLGGVGLTSYLVDRGVILQGRAAPDKTPANIAITNLAPTEFSVMYTTAESVSGSLTYGTDATHMESVTLDDRDQQTGRTSDSTVHHITVRNLTPDTTYFFSILSGGEVYKNGDDPYQVKTAPALSETPPDTPAITGTVNFPASLTKQDLLVLFSSDTLQPRSALVQADGSYTIPLAGLRTKDLSAFATTSPATTGDLVILAPDTASHAKVLLTNTHPVPLITFGQSYDFTLSTAPLTQDSSASGSAQQTFPNAGGGGAPSIEITSPDEAETFTDQQPKFSGKALPGETVDIIIHSDQAETATIKAGDDGTWEFRPPEPLNPGNHQITIKTRDLSGTLREFTRSFTVYAQGSGGFIEPSISPTWTPTPTLVPPGLTDTPTPTLAATTATPTPTLTAATPTPTTVITGIPTPTSPPPVSGSREVALGGILGAGTLVIGLVLFFLARGSIL